MKKLLSVILATAIIICAVPIGTITLTASAAKDGYYEYKLIDGEITINKVDKNISGDVIVPSTLEGYPVKAIDSLAFSECNNITSIVIPDCVVKAGSYVFRDCENLESVKLGNGITSIGSEAFLNCPKLENVVFGTSVTQIGDRAFYRCSSLVNIVLPDSVTKIESDAFYKCTKLESVTFGNGLVSICGSAFSHCNLKSLTIPENVTNIGGYAFYGNDSLADINILGVVKTINDWAFVDTAYYNDAKNWENGVLYIGSHLIDAKSSIVGECEIKTGTITIADDALSNLDDITTVNIPNGVTYIGIRAFSHCDNLIKVTVPSSVRSLDDAAFMSCEKLEDIILEDGITGIDDLVFYNTAYYNKSSNWNNDVLYIDNHLIEAKETVSGDYVIKEGTKSIAKGAFSGCQRLTSVSIPSGLTYIADSAFFDCRNITGLILLDSITYIGNSAFYHCLNLDCIFLADTLTYIGDSAFMHCDNLVMGGYKDSYAEQYAKKTGKDFYVVFDETDPNGNNVWKNISVNETGVYDAFVLFAQIENNNNSTNNTPEFAVYDKNGNFVHYNATKNGFPLVKGEEYKIVTHNYILGCRLVKIANAIFPDTGANIWYNDAVTYAVGAGIMGGYSNGLFGTSDSIQRQDFLVMLARLDGVNLDNYMGKSQFPDVGRNSYYEAAVNWGAKNGIVTGYNNGKFGVGDKVTREQLVTFLYRYAKYKGYDYTYTADRETIVSQQYNDYKNVSYFAKEAILWAIEKGVISGKTSTTIAPQGNAQRCEVAKIMYNIYQNDIFK